MNPEKCKSYDPEGQAIQIKQSQELNSLTKVSQVFTGFDLVTDCGLDWIVIGDSWYLKQNCDYEKISNLTSGAELSQLVDLNTNIVSENVDKCYPVAALLFEGSPVYLSPGFDFESYLESINK